jgi:HD-GYP domain-containing protein (c-di-GMP phosphodiesterase class II)
MTAQAQAHDAHDGAATNGHIAMTPELNAMLWVQQEARDGRPLPTLETSMVADALFMGMRPAAELGLPLLPLGDMEHYLGVHAINVATLAMGLATFLEFDEDAVRKIGMAALLHDIGMVRIPADLAAQPGQIDAADRERVKTHPVEGARIVMAASDPSLDLAAVVAYEHHIKMDGSGYPRVLFPRTGHYVSRLVQLCDIYHALRSPRPYRDAWPRPIIYSFLNERAGFEFHPALAAALTRMAQQLDPGD